MSPEFKSEAEIAANAGFEGIDAYRAYEKLQLLYDVLFLNFLVEKTEKGNRVHVSISCDTPKSLDFIERCVVQGNPDFQNVKRVSSAVISFDLSVACVKRLYDVPVESPFYDYDPIDAGLIEKYGGRDAFIKYLAALLEQKTVIEVTAITATMARHASQNPAHR
ncbi:hypothetical protein HZA42_00205 [Candidatus Peregrinibacteria bacterium]|nr:hypothetical protein [Candidatus Peregrinibacteria bacterium]